ncbi:DUF29 domain-containing protein [Gloeocapsopsis sp. IPPAS B-1203]|uniref:DUF29 domain-containing protein n=1 Tax=Gloeocapsopsis sp. IPPAS B-1203 TaxID=2049454 RepID=UPI000C19523B|nr:DUF29 domain-containing protein [Gloeocapsopsis sp. IPPAS B-1203]PIG92562.1 hypothetical protein CSQ79_15870 [Gloeocapsopsis sp. IPPAS B-1203]
MQKNTESKLYDRDFNLWLEDTVTKLRRHDVDNLDWENLIEEIIALGKREKRELIHRLEVLLSHLLKRIYIDSAYDNRGWELTIKEQRRQLQLQLEQSPSLKKYLTEIFDDCWQYALTQVKLEYAKVPFPEHWDFSRDVEAILSQEFWLQ